MGRAGPSLYRGGGRRDSVGNRRDQSGPTTGNRGVNVDHVTSYFMTAFRAAWLFRFGTNTVRGQGLGVSVEETPSHRCGSFSRWRKTGDLRLLEMALRMSGERVAVTLLNASQALPIAELPVLTRYRQYMAAVVMCILPSPRFSFALRVRDIYDALSNDAIARKPSFLSN